MVACGGLSCSSRRSFVAISCARVLPLVDRFSAALCCSYMRQHKAGGAMEITLHDHRIEQCVSMALASNGDRNKALWLTLAQCWVRLADQVACAEMARVADSGQHRH
jgi:hypothetical protein